MKIDIVQNRTLGRQNFCMRKVNLYALFTYFRGMASENDAHYFL